MTGWTKYLILALIKIDRKCCFYLVSLPEKLLSGIFLFLKLRKKKRKGISHHHHRHPVIQIAQVILSPPLILLILKVLLKKNPEKGKRNIGKTPESIRRRRRSERKARRGLYNVFSIKILNQLCKSIKIGFITVSWDHATKALS